MKIMFIVNPIAGGRKKEQIIDLIYKRFGLGKQECLILTTEKKGHATLLANQAVESGFDIVAAVGGDGTVNEVAKALIHSNTALGIIPCGSGNGLARHMKISMQIGRALDSLQRGVVQTIDYGLVNGEPFFCTCGVGFDAFVSMKFANSGKRGPLNYVDQALLNWLTYKPELYGIETENSTNRQTALFITCANASQWGNEAYIAPSASLVDGLIDVTIVEPFLAIEAGPMAIQLFSRTIDRNMRVKCFKSDKLVIHRHHPGAVHFDGDPTNMDKDVELSVVPKGLKVVVPESSLAKL